MAKKAQNVKKYFWLLAVFFGFMTMTGLLLLWSSSPSQSGGTAMMGSMMGSTMGDSARKEVGPIKLSDLFKPGEFIKSDMSSHHQGSSLISKTHFATTVTVAVTLPVIIGGLALLLALWL